MCQKWDITKKNKPNDMVSILENLVCSKALFTLPMKSMGNADLAIKFLKQFYPNSLKERFGIENITETIDVLKAIATKRSCMKAGELDIEKAESILLKEFKDGKLGKITLEWTECLI